LAFATTHTRPPTPPSPPVINDKLMHFIGFTILSLLTLWKWAPVGRKIPFWELLILYCGLLTYGAVDEITQPYAGRQCELRDWQADAAGAFVGLLVGAVIQWATVRTTAAAILLLVMAIGGCSPGPAKPPERTVRIVLIARSTESDEWPVMKLSAQKFMRDNKTIEVEVVAPAIDSPSQQRKLLGEVASRGAHAVCIYPLDPAGISSEVNAMVVSGTPVVTVGLDIPQSSRSAYCGPDETDVGEEAAQACALTMDKSQSRTLIILHAGEDKEPYSQRYRSFKNSIGHIKDGRILRDLNCNGESSEAVRLVALETQKYPRIGAWVLLDDWPIIRTPIDPAGWPSECSVVLCNASHKYFPELRSKRISALIGFDVQLACSSAIQAAAWLAGGSREGRGFDSNIPVEIITLWELPAWEKRWRSWSEEAPET
jgi:ABC-type sugar transport system substrate-binding protein